MDKNFPNFNLEIWGGIECTINRVKGEYKDQLQLAKHYTREGDLEKIAELGIRTLRYPVL
jgi:dTDP-4-dehydrorhamnose reductase